VGRLAKRAAALDAEASSAQRDWGLVQEVFQCLGGAAGFDTNSTLCCRESRTVCVHHHRGGGLDRCRRPHHHVPHPVRDQHHLHLPRWLGQRYEEVSFLPCSRHAAVAADRRASCKGTVGQPTKAAVRVLQGEDQNRDTGETKPLVTGAAS
jgi:hypothetical protein